MSMLIDYIFSIQFVTWYATGRFPYPSVSESAGAKIDR